MYLILIGVILTASLVCAAKTTGNVSSLPMLGLYCTAIIGDLRDIRPLPGYNVTCLGDLTLDCCSDRQLHSYSCDTGTYCMIMKHILEREITFYVKLILYVRYSSY